MQNANPVSSCGGGGGWDNWSNLIKICNLTNVGGMILESTQAVKFSIPTMFTDQLSQESNYFNYIINNFTYYF